MLFLWHSLSHIDSRLFRGIFQQDNLNYLEEKPSSDDGQFLFKVSKKPAQGSYAKFTYKTPIYPAGNITRYFIEFVRSLNITDYELMDKFTAEIVRLFGIDALRNRHNSGYQMIRYVL